MKTPPKISLKNLGPATDGKHFIKVQRNKYEITYPDNSTKETHIDHIERVRPDASVIIAYNTYSNTVWLRSCFRPAAAIRYGADLDFEYDGNMWELPAGLIDAGETPAEAAARECWEEIGFTIEASKFVHVQTVLCMPSLIAEKLHFYYVCVNSTLQAEPELDGSAMEAFGEIMEMPMADAYAHVKAGNIPDMKTNLGIRLLHDMITDGKV